MSLCWKSLRNPIGKRNYKILVETESKPLLFFLIAEELPGKVMRGQFDAGNFGVK